MNLIPFHLNRKKATVKENSISLANLLNDGEAFRISTVRLKER